VAGTLRFIRHRDDSLAKVAPLLDRVDDWHSFLESAIPPETGDELRKHESTGRPLGGDQFIERLERALDRVLRPRKPGPAPHEPVVRAALQTLGGELA